MADQFTEADKLAREVLLYTRNTLLVNLRFLDNALSQFEMVPYDGTFATDGRLLAYGSKHILKTNKEAKEYVTRNYLHIVMHCIFRHMFVNPLIDREYWDLACDVAADYSISVLQLKCAETPLEDEKQKIYDKLLKEMRCGI